MSERKVALITGSGRGIGLGIAKHLAADGCDIVVNDIHEPDVVKPALDELAALGAEVLYCRADISKAESRAQMLEEIKAKFGKLNILVNNAGVAPKVRADILEATEESYDRLMTINLKGPYFLTQLVANYMVEQSKDESFKGCIVNISSVSSSLPSTARGEYCISKAGVSMATKLWAARLGEFDIPVYEVQPGVIKTDMTSTVQEKYDKLIEGGLCHQRRWGFPEDIGKAVAMMARGDIAYSTGQVILVDGGLTLQCL
ncbi:MAG: 3-ketoacyl-ACP reductase [Planctomycetes bacterium]|nr:3-ketoacyl-ACP reductase [Planctomycetota bacterium]